MAEYYITYREIGDLIDGYIAASGGSELLINHRAEILTALTGEFNQQQVEEVQEMIALWDEQILPHNEAMWGSKYIRIHHCLLMFLEAALCSGMVDAMLLGFSQGSIAALTVSTAASIVITLGKLFASVKKLDDWDFCVYMQAVSHFREHEEFTLKELQDWLPASDRPQCNMHDDRWEFDHRNNDDACMLLDKERLERALQSLMDKGILSRKTERDTYKFKFER